MKISVLLQTGHFRGDHEADACEAHEALPGETVEQLVERLLRLDQGSYSHPYLDRIEIRRIREDGGGFNKEPK